MAYRRKRLPAEMTARGNYLLRSTHSGALILTCAAVALYRVRQLDTGTYALVSGSGAPVVDCHAATLALARHDLVALPPVPEGRAETPRLTAEGILLLSGALRATKHPTPYFRHLATFLDSMGRGSNDYRRSTTGQIHRCAVVGN